MLPGARPVTSGGPPPPPPPPPPAGLFSDTKADDKGESKAINALFADINKGEGVTSGETLTHCYVDRPRHNSKIRFLRKLVRLRSAVVTSFCVHLGNWEHKCKQNGVTIGLCSLTNFRQKPTVYYYSPGRDTSKTKKCKREIKRSNFNTFCVVMFHHL